MTPSSTRYLFALFAASVALTAASVPRPRNADDSSRPSGRRV